MNGSVTPELLERLLDEHGAALELFASQWTTTPEDCVQEALLQLCRQKQLPDRMVAWLYRVVRNQAISQRRSSASRSRHETAAASQRKSWFSAGRDSPIDLAKLTSALQRISAEHREVIVAKIWGGLTFEEVAEVIGISRSSTHRRYEEALSQLRERLEETWQAKDKTTTDDKTLDSTNSNAS